VAVVGLASAAALVPVPASLVERAYSRAAYPVWQSWMTSLSNVIPIALLDVLIVGVSLAWIALAVADVRRRRGWRVTLLRIGARIVVWGAVLYLMFLASWGLN